MIASIRGVLIASGTDHVVVETGGVGFQIFVPRPTLNSLGAIGSEVRLFTHLIVREDLLALYGFADSDQRSLFETLLSVSGVGAKLAIGMLSSASPDELRVALAGGDTSRLARIPGIGKKTAERLVLELKGKVTVRGGPLPAGSIQTPAALSVQNELIDMLLSLGFSAAEANAAAASIPADAPPALEERLRLALRYFGSV